jgi:cyclopropane fatty-acyl-phospholipid synthase-like methyltransferase
VTGGVVAVNHDARDLVDDALRTARLAAYPPGEFVGQESFMRASEIRQLAERAGIGPDSRVLDLCCGAGGPGVLIAREFGCSYYGVDASASAVRLARGRARDVDCHFDVAEIPPLPAGGYDVVLLFETMLAFPDKRELFGHVAAALPPGGRFVFTVEEGEPLSESERASMPDSGTVWLAPLAELRAHLQAAGLHVTVEAECTRAHQEIAQRLYDAFRADATGISARLGPATLESLLSAHRLWSEWLRTGRVRKFALVAERI